MEQIPLRLSFVEIMNTLAQGEDWEESLEY